VGYFSAASPDRTIFPQSVAPGVRLCPQNASIENLGVAETGFFYRPDIFFGFTSSIIKAVKDRITTILRHLSPKKQ